MLPPRYRTSARHPKPSFSVHNKCQQTIQKNKFFFLWSNLSSFGARPYVRRNYTAPVYMIFYLSFLFRSPLVLLGRSPGRVRAAGGEVYVLCLVESVPLSGCPYSDDSLNVAQLSRPSRLFSSLTFRLLLSFLYWVSSVSLVSCVQFYWYTSLIWLYSAGLLSPTFEAVSIQCPPHLASCLGNIIYYCCGVKLCSAICTIIIDSAPKGDPMPKTLQAVP